MMPAPKTNKPEFTKQAAEITGLLCQKLAENPAIHETILHNYDSELFWLKQNIGAKISADHNYVDSAEYQADTANLALRTLAYKQAKEITHLQAQLKQDPMHRQIILDKYMAKTELLKQKLAASSQDFAHNIEANFDLMAREWAYHYEQQNSAPAISRADTREPGQQQIVAAIEKNKQKLYRQLAENPQDSQKILAKYKKKLDLLQATIAAKKAQQGELYTKSTSYDTDTTELQVSDQAYEQVCRHVTGHGPKWLDQLEQEVSNNKTIGAWIQLALAAAQTTSLHLAQSLGITSTLYNVSKPQSRQTNTVLSNPDSSKTLDTPIKAAAKFKPGLPIEPVFAATSSRVIIDPFRTTSIEQSNLILERALDAYRTYLGKMFRSTLVASRTRPSNELDQEVVAKLKLVLEHGADANDLYKEYYQNNDEEELSSFSDYDDDYESAVKIELVPKYLNKNYHGNLNNPPSYEVVELLLHAKRPLNPDIVLHDALEAPNTNKDVVKLALEHGADADQIYSLRFLSYEVVELLLGAKKPLNPDKLLFLALSSYHYDDALTNNLIKLAVAKGANLDKFPYLKNYYQSGVINHLPRLGQSRLQEKLVDMLLKYFPEDEAMLTLAQHLAAGKGECISYTTLWLYSKYQQSKQPDKRGGYNQDYDKNWYGNTIKNIDLYDDNQVLNAAEIADIKRFAQTLDFLESPRYYQEGFRPADTRMHEVDNRLTTDGKIFHEQYKIALAFQSDDQLETFLAKILHDGAAIYVASSFGDIHTPGHFTGVVKHGSKYCYYDPLDLFGEVQYDSLHEVALRIRTSCHGFIVGSFEPDYTDYPAPESILSANYPANYKFTKEELEKGAITAILVRSKESLKFYLDHGLSPRHKNKYGVSLIQAAVLANDQDSVKMLIELGADPNDCAMQQTSCLHLAAIKGFPQVAKTLLTDPRTKIAQQDGNKTTALEIAKNKKYTQTAEQIETEIKERLAQNKIRHL